jgi:N-acetylneuraminate synthase/N,N'-diacetyllegionaminate synthase
MTDLDAIRAAVNEVKSAPHAVLHCVSSYPAPYEQVNLRAMALLERELGCPIGYSDHTLGVEACIAAVALGARIIEKHFTLSKTFSEFRDHQLSSDPPEMTRLVEQIRHVEQLLGEPKKARQACEAPIEPIARRSIVAARDLAPGKKLSDEDLLCVRPGDGLRASQVDALVGRTLKRAVSSGEALALADLE